MQRKGFVFLFLIVLLTGFIAVFPVTAQDETAESEDALLTVLEAYVDAFAGDAETFPQFLTQDVVRHHLRGPDMDTGELAVQSGIDEIAENAAGFQTALPGVEFVVDYSVERNDYVWTSLSTTELPDTDGVVLRFVLTARFVDGKIAEIWVADDELAMLSLLNVLPEQNN